MKRKRKTRMSTLFQVEISQRHSKKRRFAEAMFNTRKKRGLPPHRKKQ